MISAHSRREFLKRSLLAGAALSPSLAGLACVETAREKTTDDTTGAGSIPGGYGALIAAGPMLALPQGFHYTAFGIEYSAMSDGLATPGAHDGMAAFDMGDGTIRLVRNHEVRGEATTSVAVGDPAQAYDRKGGGGTSTLEVRLRGDSTVEPLRSWMSLTGTLVNCAGGPTPWGSWLTCEETTLGRLQGWEQDHGYVFEVPATANAPVPPVPLKAMGRFVHEAVAIDPQTGIVYLTEDRSSAGFYRFIPNRPGRLIEGGRLQMLSIAERPRLNAAVGQQPGAALPVSWVDIADPDPASGSSDAVFLQGFSKGATQFSRLEGAWWGDDSVYFHATNGGDKELGQVWRHRPRGGGNGSDGDLLLVFESVDAAILSNPDNITVTPRGGLVLCEDTAGTCHLRGLSARGEIFPFARNIGNNFEFAGATFSPDGRVLFVNIQGITRPEEDARLRGMTLAIWGPWEKGSL